MTAAAHRVETDAGEMQRDQGTGKVFRLVGEYGQPEPGILQAAKGRDKAGIGRSADAEVGGIVGASRRSCGPWATTDSGRARRMRMGKPLPTIRR